MRVCILQHSDGTRTGSLIPWIEKHGHTYTLIQLHHGERLPAVQDFECIVILGGPINVDEVQKYPWLLNEKHFINEAIDAKKICIGLCLGGQLLAEALGARVGPNKHWEVGWHDIQFQNGESGNGKLKVFQWHQEIFDLPKGATQIATSVATPVQAFRYSNFILATQFHPESTREWVEECAGDDDYPSGPFVQSPEEIVRQLDYVEPMQNWFYKILDELTASVALTNL